MTEQIFQIGVKGIIQNEKGELLLTLTKFPERELWDIPGGRIDEGENMADTLRRELYEEIGVTEFDVVQQIATVVSPKKIPYEDGQISLALVAYRIRLGRGQKPIAREESTEIYWKFAPEAAELLHDKYPPEFCKEVSSL